ncbi:MAG TPA: hypothetical protein VKA47_01485 [Solirubrobacterales bacterium]|nr:hypothetical protein [Solirubrobacterales bacterium]
MTSASEPGNGQREDAVGDSRRYVESGLAVLGLDAGADEIAVIEAVDAIYGPSLEALLAEGFDGIPHEPGADMSKPPRTDDER